MAIYLNVYVCACPLRKRIDLLKLRATGRKRPKGPEEETRLKRTSSQGTKSSQEDKQRGTTT